jgi:hypothetical protein
VERQGEERHRPEEERRLVEVHVIAHAREDPMAVLGRLPGEEGVARLILMVEGPTA